MNLWKKFYNATLTGVTNIRDTFKINGTAVTSTADELNILDGVLATAAELNRVCDSSTRVVSTTSTAITVSATTHGS